MASGAYKKAFTGLTGMAVSRNPTHTLGVLYRFPSILLSHLLIIESDLLWLETQRFISSKNLRALAKMPADFPYRFNYTASIFFTLLHVALAQ